MGPGLFLGSATFEVTEPSASPRTFRSLDATFKPTIGFVSVLGFESEINEKVRFFAETNLQQAAYRVSELTIAKYTEDGVDMTKDVDMDPDVAGIQKSYKYEKNSRVKEPPPVLQGSNFGVRIGLKLSLN